MSTTEQSTVIGVFRDRSLADAAIHELHQADFRDDQVHLLGHSSGNALEGLKNLFSPKHTSTTPNTADELAQAGIGQDNVAYYQQEIEAGNYIVAVQSNGQQRQAREILYQHGAYDASTDESRIGGGGRVVPVREEQFHVDKHFVQTGEVVIRKRVITENKTFTIPVMREEVTIERLPVQGNATSNTQMPTSDASLEREDNSNPTDVPITNGRETVNNNDTIRVLVREERVVFTKQPVVIEEIIVRKQQVQENREISDILKREEVHIEHSGNIIIHDDGVDTKAQ